MAEENGNRKADRKRTLEMSLLRGRDVKPGAAENSAQTFCCERLYTSPVSGIPIKYEWLVLRELRETGHEKRGGFILYHMK